MASGEDARLKGIRNEMNVTVHDSPETSHPPWLCAVLGMPGSDIINFWSNRNGYADCEYELR